ncbi:MAG: hypothetical protein ACOX8Q_03875 [Christensenellales bacterium]|jgi:hypothetical protein
MIMVKLKNKSTLLTAVGVSVILLVGAVMMVVFMSGESSVSAFSLSNTGTAKLTVNVVEGYTETPIAGAKVVVVETGKVYDTDNKGNTGVIEVPYVRDTRYDDILSKPWGETTLIVYKEGFLPYALFYLQVINGETREGVKILLFEQNSAKSSEPFSIIEGPNRVWVDALVKMFQP